MAEAETIKFKVREGKNFTGFVHPITNQLVTAMDDGVFIVSATDTKAIEVLKAARDLHQLN